MNGYTIKEQEDILSHYNSNTEMQTQTESRLYLHCGAFQATKEDIQATETPEGSDTWKPVPHIEVVRGILEEAYKLNMEVDREQYGLNKSGTRMFGVIDFRQGNSELGYSVGIRNSHDKTIACGIAAGARIFVCDNLALSGEYQVIHKHTPKLNVQNLISDAFALLPQNLEKLSKNLDRLKQEGVNDDDAQRLIWRAALANAIPSSDMMPVWQEFKKPRHEEFTDPNKYNLLMAFTEVAKGIKHNSRAELTYRRLGELFEI